MDSTLESAGEAPHSRRLFAPLLSQARERLRLQSNASLYSLLSTDALAGWETFLYKRLYSTSARSIAQEYQRYCSVRSAFADVSDGLQSNDRSAYDRFIGEEPNKRLQKILCRFPYLAEVTQILINNWVDTVIEFLGRLSTDLTRLSIRFSGMPFTCPIQNLQAGLSDPHRGGRCVVRIKFQNSVELVYKPRSLAPESHFFSFLEQLNSNNIPYPLKCVRCCDRGEYGWMEHVASQPCTQPADLQAFYWRAGALLALIYLLRGVDMHRENLLAVGAYPVLIDLETLWHPQEHVGASDHPDASTVLRTGFLPQPESCSSTTYQAGALCREALPSTQASSHLPMVAGVVYPAPRFLTDILAGFHWIGHQVFKEHRVADEFRLCAKALARSRRRRVLRSTSWYHLAVERMTDPSSLRNIASFAAASEMENHGGPAMNEQERSALLEMDIPYLVQCNDTDGNENVTPLASDFASFERQEAIVAETLQMGI